MRIRPLLEAEAGIFGPEDIEAIVAGFEDALRAMGLVDRSDPAVALVAKATMETAKQGESDPIRLREKVDLNLRPAKPGPQVAGREPRLPCCATGH
jgi:hypothetical protein